MQNPRQPMHYMHPMMYNPRPAHPMQPYYPMHNNMQPHMNMGQNMFPQQPPHSRYVEFQVSCFYRYCPERAMPLGVPGRTKWQAHSLSLSP